MRVITMQDLAGTPEELAQLLSTAQQRRQELMQQVVDARTLPKSDAPLACWYAYADAEVRYCTEIETWVLAAQGKSVTR